MLLVGNTLYGTTLNGGTYGKGTIFSVPLTGGQPTILASFNGTDGDNPDTSSFSSATCFTVELLAAVHPVKARSSRFP
jgi:uncharacterized repeat protein (TIGR03803 family)